MGAGGSDANRPPPPPNTAYTILRPGALPERGAIDWPKYPGWKRIGAFMVPLLGLGRNYMHMAVLYREKKADMFVDDRGDVDGLPVNEEATKLARAYHLKHNPGVAAADLPAVYGVAALFDREVWS